MSIEKNGLKSGLKWNSLAQIINQASVFIAGIVLMKLLEPQDFGLVAIVSVFLGLAQLLTTSGITSSLINNKEVGKIDYDNLFSFSFCLGLFFSVVFYSLSNYLSVFFEDPRLENLFQIAALALLVSPLGSIPSSILKRKLEFKVLAIINMCSTFTALFIAIYMAMNDYGYYSLIAQKLVYILLNVILLFFAARYWPSIKLNYVILKKHLSFGIPVLGSKVVNYSIGNIDNFLIGKFMTPISLGYYSRAFSLVTIPSTRIGMVINSTLFPVFSNMKNKGLNINKTVLNLYEIILYALFLLSLLYIINAKAFVDIISPDGKWDSIIPIIKILAIIAIAKPITRFYSSILLSLGLSKKVFNIEILGGILIVIGYVFGVFIDLIWFSYIYAINIVLFLIYYSIVFSNTLKLAKFQLLHLVKYKILSFLIILLFNRFTFNNIKFTNAYVEFSLGVLLVIASWFFLNFIFERKTTKLILSSVKSMKK